MTVAKDIQFPQFEMNNFAPFDCDKDYFGSKYNSCKDIYS